MLVAGGIAVNAVYGPPMPKENKEEETTMQDETQQVAGYQKINPDEAKRIIDGNDPYVLLDVRTKEEFDTEHIPGALLLPADDIYDEIASIKLPDKTVLIMVYCRSGGRSAEAAKTLIELGYINVYDIGGIIDWPYETIAK